jgi:hypothetical protein
MSNEVFIDIGEESMLRMSTPAMAKVLKALIVNKGKLHDSHVDRDACVLRLSIPSELLASFTTDIRPITVSMAPRVGV